MEPPPAAWRDAVVHLVERGHLTGPVDLGRLVAEATTSTEATVVVYVVDYEQRGLRPLPPGGGEPESVDGSRAGEAFSTLRPAPIAGPVTGWWVPMVNGTERIGVIRVAVPAAADPAGVLAGARLLAGAAGHLHTAKTQYGDSIERVRRSRPMTPAAELLWRLLPPLTFSGEQMAVTAILEPCYEVGGDAFDYAVDGQRAHLAVYDGVGKGMRAALTTGAALGAVRATRRGDGDLEASATAADAALTAEFRDARFVTAVLAELDLADGRLRYLNAGHPPPVLLRRGRALHMLGGGRRSPLGVERRDVQIGEEAFEPGDRLLLYTDGLGEARRDGRFFPIADRAWRLLGHGTVGDGLASLESALIEWVQGRLDDDIALVLMEYAGPQPAVAAVPSWEVGASDGVGPAES
jgi:phosphoserine phosphatase RsbU/P